MGTLAIALAGGVAGYALGGPIGAQIGFALAGAAGGALSNTLDHRKGSNDANANTGMTSEWGRPIKVLYGTTRVAGTMIWCGPLKTKGSGGKGGVIGGGSATAATSKVTCSFAVAFCAGPISGIVRMWADGQLIFDSRTPSPVPQIGGFAFSFYPGSESQLPDPFIQDWVSKNIIACPAACPAYRGLAYVVFHDAQINKTGSRVPQISAEVTNADQANLPEVQFTNSTAVTSTAPRQLAVDFTRQVAYAFTGPSQISVYSLNTLTQIGVINTGSDGSPVATGFTCGQGGDIFFVAGASNTSPIYKYSADSYTRLDVFGTASGSFANTKASGFVFADTMTVITATGDGDSVQFLLCTGLYGLYGILRVDRTPMIYIMGDPLAGGYVPLPNNGIYGHSTTLAGLQANGYSEAYILNSSIVGGSTIEIMQVVIYASALCDGLGITTGVQVLHVGTLHASDFNPGAADWNGVSCPNLAYDPGDDSLILNVDNATIKWSVAHGVIWQQSTDQQMYSGGISPQAQINGDLSFSQAGLGSPNQFVTIDTTTGSVTQRVPVTSGLNDATGGVYESTSRSVTYPGSAVVSRAFLGLGSFGPFLLADLLLDICLRAGLAASQVDVTAIGSTTVAGYLLDGNKTCREAIQELQQAYFFDAIESDYKLKFVPRNAGSSIMLTQADLASVTSPQDGDYWQHTRNQDQDLPTYVQVDFTDSQNEELPSSAYAKRTYSPRDSIKTRQRQTIGLPIAMALDDATIIAQKALYAIWSERDTYETKLSVKHLGLDIADCITVLLDDGNSYPVRVTKLDLGADYAIKMTCVGYDGQVYVQATTVVAQPSPYAQQVRGQYAFSKLFLLNAPLLRDQDDTADAGAVFYFGAGAYGTSYSGAILQSSGDGLTYSQIDYLATQLTWGSCLTILPDALMPFSTDTTTRLRVALVNANEDLASLSDVDFLAGGNGAMVGNEVIQFQTVVANGDGSVTLSNLARGRRGTDWACTNHQAGETFVLLDSNLHLKVLPIAAINAGGFYKLQPIGATLDVTPTAGFTFKGYDRKPYAPVCHARAMSGSDLLVSWQRRSRIGGALVDGTGTVALGEESESYDAYLLAAPYTGAYLGDALHFGAPTVFVRSFLGLTGPSLTYTAAAMAADGFAPGTATLHLVVFQNSATVGHGWPGAADLAAF